MIVHGASTVAPPTIKRVQFHVLSPEQIRNMSVVEITETSTYNRGLPAPGGVQDARMGTVDRRVLCATCNMDSVNCQGHSGHIELPFPMYHSVFFETVLKVLRCSCFMCGRVCAVAEDLASVVADDVVGKARLSAVYAAVRTRRRCPHCGVLRPSFVRTSMSVRVDWPSDMAWESDEEREYCTRPFTQRDALSMLNCLTDEDCVALGFDPALSHPKHMIMTVLLVPPPAMRPTITASQGSKTRAQDDLTHKLQDIAKRSNDLRNVMKGAPWRTATLTPEIVDRIARLQYEVFTIVNNSVRGQRPSLQRSGLPTKTYIGRLKGKDGRIRGNLMGKRVDHCARCVISPGPRLDIDEVGVPKSIAVGLTVPETVTAHNLRALTDRVRRGADRLDGAESVITTDGVVIHLAQCTSRQRICLVEGYIVERYLQNGDVVAFNRQPSLHKLGLMGHRVVLVDDMTMRLNLSVTAPYNADFDGDEMNLHVPQHCAARASVRTLMMVSDQIISPQNKPCMGIVQDSLVGLFRMTRTKEMLTKLNAAHMIGHLKHASVSSLSPPFVVHRGRPYWSGRQIVSLLLSADLSLCRERATSLDDGIDVHSGVVIVKGQLLSGRLTKSLIGTTAGGVVDVVCRDAGNLFAARMLSDMQRLALAYNELRGFSVGISDCILGEDGARKVRERIRIATSLANDITSELQRMKPTADQSQVAEATIRSILGKALMQAGSIVETHLRSVAHNAVHSMVQSGSKGSAINLSQIHACVGQQSVEGQRISSDREGRSLPCFDHDDTSLASHGFVESSYVDGVQPYEFFYHSMGGREGIVDTAVKTAQSGYIQRRQVKAMESHRVEYDGTVRNSSGGVVQFEYNGNGFDPCKLERVKLSVLTMSVADVVDAHATRADAERVLKARERLFRGTQLLGTKMDDRVTLPFDALRLREKFQTAERSGGAGRRRPPRSSAGGRARGGGGRREDVDEFLEFVDAQTDACVQISLNHTFPSESLRRSNPTDVRALLAHLKRTVSAARVEPGAMVGVCAAQSIGEPTTQMSLRGSERVLVRDSRGVASRRISDVVDERFERERKHDGGGGGGGNSHHGGEGLRGSEVLDVSAGELQVVGVTPHGRVHWADVLAVSRHPANGPMIEVVTESGRTVVGTASHSYLVRNPSTGLIVPMRGDELRRGDLFPVVRKLPNADPFFRDIGRVISGQNSVGNLCENDASLVEFLLESDWFCEYVAERPGACESIFQGLVENGWASTDGLVHVSVRPGCENAVYCASIVAGIQPVGVAQQDWTFRYCDVCGVYEQTSWDPIRSIVTLGDSSETVYDFTVQEGLQSFMLTNGIFVHNTLNTFHSAGIASKNVTLGIPRLQELLTVSKNMRTPCCTIRFRGDLGNNEAAARYFADTMPLTTLGDLVLSCDIVDDPDPRRTVVSEDAWMVDASNALEGCVDEASGASRFVVRMRLNQQLMWTRHTTPPDVRRLLRVRLSGRAHVLSSEVNEPEWIVRVRFFHGEEMVSAVGMPNERQAVLSHRIVSVLLKTLVVCGHPNAHSAAMRHESSHRARHADLLPPPPPTAAPRRQTTTSKHDGMRGRSREVEDAMEEDDGEGSGLVENDALKKGELELRVHDECVVDVVGNVLKDLVCMPMVDWSRCYTNDVVEVQNTLGIAAAAEVLYSEIRDVISFDGTYVFPGHLSLMVDTMCRDGYIKPLNRFGVNRDHSNALARSSYEETPDILTEAAIFAEDTSAAGVSTSIILGQRAEIGTGIVSAQFHTSMLPKRILQSASSSNKLVVKTQPGPANTVHPSPAIEYVLSETGGRAGDAPGSSRPPVKMKPPVLPYEEDADAANGGGASVATEVFAPDTCERPYTVFSDGDGGVGNDGTASSASFLQPAEGGGGHDSEFASVPVDDHLTFRLHSPPRDDDDDDD